MIRGLPWPLAARPPNLMPQPEPTEAMQSTPVPVPVPEKPVLRFGLTEVHAPKPVSSALVDIVFVHGLNGHPENTWTSKETQVFWPRDLLPEFIEDQKGRVLVYGYDADVASLASTGVTKDKIHNHAERLMADLFANRRIRKATERPIIFIAHSLGGLIVKRALISSSEISGAKTEHLRSIYTSTYGILFLGTPHKGSDLGKWGTYLSWLCQAVIPSKLASSESQLVEALKTNSETLLNIDRQFAQLVDDFHLFFFHEAKPTNLKGTLHFIVDEESAAPTLPDVERAGIQADHSHMCKFDSSSAPGFDLVIDGIQRYSDQAPAVIRNRWVMEKQERLTRAKRKAKENYPIVIGELNMQISQNEESFHEPSPGNSLSDLALGRDSARKSVSQVSSSVELQQQTNRPSEPYFIVPPGFRANTFFVGMEKEMHDLDRKLFDSRRREGTACVLLHGQPGVGKSHVARQYVYKNRYKFQGGVFWINAQLMDEVYKDYWQIHQKVLTRVAPERIQSPSSEALGHNFVDDVREWFSEREDWLIIFDGVSVEHDKDVDALQRFIPDSSNSGIIYVSRSKRLETMQRLLRPQAIKIMGLKEQDAQALLFKELGIKTPRQAQSKAAKGLVRKVGGLPLAISAIARRLADTHEPIEKFNLKSYADDPKLGATYHHIMTDLQKNGHREAINLMNILCFFGPHIPVEMIHLGLKSLRQDQIEVRSREEEGGTSDINLTFSILMRHALIERNEPDDGESMSSSRDSMVEPEPIDVLNLHAVIQRFWCDSLNNSKQLSMWLRRAVSLLNFSYREADYRITRQIKPGRVSDYRWYLIHARRLRNRCKDYESRHQRLQDLKDDLDALVKQIEAEIKRHEPGSSQESLTPGGFQTSIFDRTSSSSSSEPSHSSLDRHNPEHIIIGNVNSGNFTEHESPTNLTGLVLDPRVTTVGSDMRYPIIYSYPMQKDLSGSTVRPGSAGGILAEANLPSPSRATRISPRRSDSFRSTSAVPMIHRGHAIGMVSVAPHLSQPGEFSSNSNAASILANLHSRKALTPRTTAALWPWGVSRGPPVPQPFQTVPLGAEPPYEIQSSQAMFRGYSAPEAIVPSGSPLSVQPGLSKTPLMQSSDNLQAVLGQAPPQTVTDIGTIDSAQLSKTGVLGPNPDPLPYEGNISVQSIPSHMRGSPRNGSTSRGGSRAGSRAASRPPSRPGTNPDPSSYQNSPRTQYPTTMVQGNVVPEGLISPISMSRDNSDQSHPQVQLAEAAARSRGSDASAHARRSSGSPLQRATMAANTAPLPSVPFLDPGTGAIPRYSTSAAVQEQPASAFETALPPPPMIHGIAGYPLYPSTQFPTFAHPGAESDPVSRRTSVPGVAIEGLGLVPQYNDQLGVDRSDAEAQQRILDWQRRASLQQDPRVPTRIVPRELAERDANINLRTFNLNRNLHGPHKGQMETGSSEFSAYPSVSFAAPNYLQTPSHPFHQRSNSAIESYGHGLAQMQAMQQHQALQNPAALVSNPALATLGGSETAAGLANSGMLPVDPTGMPLASYAAFEGPGVGNRSGLSYVPVAAAYPADTMPVPAARSSQRRRTLSAPESPGYGSSVEKKLWGQ